MTSGSVGHSRDAELPAWEFAATGTRWRVFHDGALSDSVVDAVVRAVAADERRWSRFLADSEVSAINRNAGKWAEVSLETWDLLEACVTWVERSLGVFTPLIGAALRSWGYEHSLDRVPAGRDRSPRPVAVTGTIELDRTRRRVRIPGGASIDLGGIAKGWIADRVATLIASSAPGHGVVVDAGGDLVVVDGVHVVAVESVHHHRTGILGFVRLTAGQAIATSGFGRRSWTNGDGIVGHHLIDPRTGAPGPSVHATVVAEDAVTADVTAKLLALRPDRLDQSQVPALLQRDGETVTGAHWRFVSGTAILGQ